MKILRDKITECHTAIGEVEKKSGASKDNRAMNVFFDAYQIHRKKYGSIQHLNGKEYDDAMCKRYEFMKNETIKYLEDLASKTEKANVGGGK